jgi:spore coat protein U-like protein
MQLLRPLMFPVTVLLMLYASGVLAQDGKCVLSGGSGSLRYNLFVDAARTQVLGDGTGGSTHMNLTIRGTLTQAFWGRIPAGQSTVATGFYSDTLIATISY